MVLGMEDMTLSVQLKERQEDTFKYLVMKISKDGKIEADING